METIAETEIVVKENNFNAFISLNELAGGNLSYEYTKKFKELLATIKEEQKSGSITLKITVDPMPDFGEFANKIIPEITMKLPKEKLEYSVRYISKENDLIKEDPKQLLLKGL